MEQVFSQVDYRKMVLEWFQRRKCEPAGYSWREFAKACGYSSPVYLKLVSDGKSNLSEVGIERVATCMGLTGRELQYFRALVRFNQAKDSQVKKGAFAEMRELSSRASVKILDEDQFDYYQSWHHSALRELAPQIPGASLDQLGEALHPQVSAAKVRKSLELLERIGLLSSEQGRYVQTTQSISSGSEITSLSVRDLHSQMAGLAIEALENVPREERDVSGLTLGLTVDAYNCIVRELADFRRRVVAIATENPSADRVYRLNLQLFPLSKPLHGEEVEP